MLYSSSWKRKVVRTECHGHVKCITNPYPQSTGTKACRLRIWSWVSGSKGSAERLIQFWLKHFCHLPIGQAEGPGSLIHSLLGLCGRCSYRAHHWRLTQTMMTYRAPSNAPQTALDKVTSSSKLVWHALNQFEIFRNEQ